MQETPIHIVAPGMLFALVGNPNCGKTALFNRLTGSQQKVANYAGVTVERKEGRYSPQAGLSARILDLPGTYSLHPHSEDERVTCEVLAGTALGERRPDVVICVLDATNLRRSLRLVFAIQRQGLPCIVAVNMMDEARARGIEIDITALAELMGVPVVSTIAVREHGDQALRSLLDTYLQNQDSIPKLSPAPPHIQITVEQDHQRAQQILSHLGIDHLVPDTRSAALDAVVLHPIAGPLILLLILFGMFQAMFDWATIPMGWIEAGTASLADLINTALDNTPLEHGYIKSLLIDGILAGVGGVLVFLPQILILFCFILLLEESGYLPRAAFLLDRLMGRVGLSGRSFIPLLSCFACAIPGITAARTISSPRDRNVTILLAPLMTCSARLPVYTLLISAFIPEQEVLGGLSLQGLILFGLYIGAIATAMLIAWLLKITTTAGRTARPLRMELPSYRIPRPRNILIGLWQRAYTFLRRVGGIILVMTVGLWVLLNIPSPPEGVSSAAAIEYSVAGWLGQQLAYIVEPIGFNWQIAISLIPGLAAREVTVSALGTVYALADGVDTVQALVPVIHQHWGLATGMALLAWYIFAPQCLPTFAAMRRETGTWRIPMIAFGYMLVLAYLAAGLAYRFTLLLAPTHLL